jgi:hypothetical protein
VLEVISSSLTKGAENKTCLLITLPEKHQPTLAFKFQPAGGRTREKKAQGHFCRPVLARGRKP